MATVNIKIGNNTLNGVDTIKVTDATDTSSTIDFVYGTTPSGSVGIKVGDNTLTGVNQINVMGTDDNYKSFGYAPSGFTVEMDIIMQDVGYDYCNVYLNGDDTTSYNVLDTHTFTFTNVTSIKFDANVSIRNSDYSADYHNNVWYEIDADTTIHLVGND